MQHKDKSPKGFPNRDNSFFSYNSSDFDEMEIDPYYINYDSDYESTFSNFNHVITNSDNQNQSTSNQQIQIHNDGMKRSSTSNAFGPTKKKVKKIVEKIELTANGKNFREIFDFHLNDKHKKIPKKKVIAMYNKVCGKLNLPYMSREEKRSINKFFNNYGYKGVEIVKAIKESIQNDKK